MAEGIASGRIVETEAYVVDAAAGHAYRGMTPRNRSLFPERGYAYVYLAYGSAYMLNVSSEVAGIGAGVLIRALEPRDGIPIMQRNRQIERLRDLARGPGRLTAALRVDRRFDGLDLCREGPLWLGQSRAIAINRCAVSTPNRRSAILASRPRPVAASARKASARRTAKASQGHQIEIKTPKRKPAELGNPPLRRARARVLIGEKIRHIGVGKHWHRALRSPAGLRTRYAVEHGFGARLSN